MSCASVSRVQTVWDELDQRIMDKATKLASRPIVATSSTNFETLVQNDRLHERFTFCKNLSGINDFTETYL